MENERIEKEFVDENGEENKMVIETSDVYRLNMENANYCIAKEMKPKKLKKFYKNAFISEVGIKSSGFTRVFLLSFIVAIAAVVILYFVFKY